MLDSHCHLDFEPLISDLPLILQEARDAGIGGFILPGVHPDGWQTMQKLASVFPQIAPAFGVHPMYAATADEQTLDRLSAIAADGIAIGEIGLDTSCTVSLSIQETAFREQIRLAHKAGLPLLIHCRQAFLRTLQLLKEERADLLGGIMHSFSGSPEMAREFIRLGFAISLSGSVTWCNAVKPPRLVRELPLEHLVLESDAPDMAPQRYRSCINRPVWIKETALRVAEIKGIPLEEVVAATTATVQQVLRESRFTV